jgi:hypothetical protein
MKTATFSILLMLPLLILLSCKKEDNSKQYRQYILAGEKEENVVYHDFTPDLAVTMVKDSSIGMPSTALTGNLTLDLDFDNINDIKFHSFTGLGHSGSLPTASQGCEVSEINSNWEIEICKTPLLLNDTINRRLNWTKIVVYGTSVSSYTPAWQNFPEEKDNVWNESGKYMGYRMIHSNDTIYGWLALQVDNYYKLKIRETAKCN